jgi:hypothetical protein
MSSALTELLRAQPGISRFNPLGRIIFFDDFDNGINGWTELIGNYEGSLDTVLPPYRDHRPPQLSNLSMWDTGSVGSIDGTYALKIATRAKKGHQSVSMKRVTFRKAGPLRLEFYFAFKPEASELLLSDQDVRSIGFLYDLQDARERVMPHMRYLNCLDGELQHKWQYKKETTRFHDIGGSGKTVSHYHLAPEGWIDVPGGQQRLCYNEIATKHNWHYVRHDFDLVEMKHLAFQVNDRQFDTSSLESIHIPAMPNLWCMLNVIFFAEADSDKRVFFYLDSVMLSGDF